MTGIEFDLFWMDNVEERIAYFFRWEGQPRCTVLTIWIDRELTFVEIRKAPDQLVDLDEGAEIETEVLSAFFRAGYSVGRGAA